MSSSLWLLVATIASAANILLFARYGHVSSDLFWMSMAFYAMSKLAKIADRV